MALRTKYLELINAATNSGVTQLQVREDNNVLYIDGNAPSEVVKKNLWEVYNRIDPDYRSGDLLLNLTVTGEAVEENKTASEVYEVQSGDSLSKIASRYNLTWRDIYEANRDVVKDPDLIQPGWKLKIPRD